MYHIVIPKRNLNVIWLSNVSFMLETRIVLPYINEATHNGTYIIIFPEVRTLSKNALLFDNSIQASTSSSFFMDIWELKSEERSCSLPAKITCK